MDKLAQDYKDPRRKSLDEEKKNLFAEKKKWNQSLKLFRKELGIFSRALNGNVEGRERVQLNESLPEESISLLDNLINYFLNRAEAAKEIIKDQSEYSQKYNSFFAEKNKKANQENFNLIKNAIHPLGVKWESVKSFFGNSEDSERTSIIQQIFEVDQELSSIQNKLLSLKSKEDCDALNKQISNAYELFNVPITLINSYLNKKYYDNRRNPNYSEYWSSINQVDRYVADPRKESQEIRMIEKDIQYAKKIYSDFMSDEYQTDLFGEEKVSNFSRDFLNCYRKIASLIKDFFSKESFRGTSQSSSISSDIITQYSQLHFIMYRDIRLNSQIDGLREHEAFKKSFHDKRKIVIAYNYSNNLEKYSTYAKPYDSIFSKTDKSFSKFKLKYLTFSKIKGNIQRCSETIDEIRTDLNEAINELTSSTSVDYQVLSNILKPASNSMMSLKEQFRAIENYVNFLHKKEQDIKNIKETKIREKEEKKKQKSFKKPLPTKPAPKLNRGGRFGRR